VAAVTSACVVGGVPTMGTACLVAILAHEIASITCAATCIAWILDCFQAPSGDPIVQGCEF
jgi:ApbE superfamily uncharacterized protein (UPF0280 family)